MDNETGASLAGEEFAMNSKAYKYEKMIMPKGSVCIFFGSLVHSAGPNKSNVNRMAATVQYTQPWVRTQQNYMLSVPLDTVKELPNKLQAMIGYSMHNMYGNTNGRHPLKYIDILLKRYSKL